MNDNTRIATDEENEDNPPFMVEENQMDPDVGKPAVMYGFRDPETDVTVYIYWRNWKSRRETLDGLSALMEIAMDEVYEQRQIDQLNDLYNNS